MNKLFVDDKRSFDEPGKAGYTCVKTYERAIILLDIYKKIGLEVVNLDYDLGESKTGLDILIYMKENNINPKEIIIHSTHSEGVRKMMRYAKDHFSCQYSYCPIG